MESFFEPLIAAYSNGDNPALVFFMTALLGLAGGVVASFSGLVAGRLGGMQDGGSVLAAISRPPSACDGCGRRLGFLELIPVVGWFLVRGRCPSCAAKIPFAYPAAEFLAAVTTASLPFVFGGFGLPTLSAILILWIGILISWIDIREFIIPEELTWLLMFFGLIFSPFEADVWLRVCGAALCGGSMWLSLAWVGWLRGLDTRAGGDVALAVACGAWIGVEGSVTFLLAASAVFIGYALPMRMRGVEWVPMGPALAAALLLTAVMA